MSALFSNQSTTSDLVRLKQFLNESLGKAGVQLPQGDHTQLLNLACGRADESAVLADVFGKQGISLTGLDIRDREIGEAQERWKKFLPEHAEAEFLVQDCAKLDDLGVLPDDFNIAFMRHQNFWNGDTTWSKIYDQALHRLKEDGLLVITSYFDREHQLALDAIQNLGAELVLSEQNTQSRKLHDVPAGVEKSVDRHVAIFKKS
ncbi:class I SAM-dependent methyltransferase [Verrucomicrobiaceae bacterium R5-34]|nr:class I SAM-dependent methyltransferase [Verrucomicrobiaceae bacterium R5-34]